MAAVHSAYDAAKRDYEEMTRKKEPSGRWITVSYEERFSSSAIAGTTRHIRESELPGILKMHPNARITI